jgi:hypothetical protein
LLADQSVFSPATVDAAAGANYGGRSRNSRSFGASPTAKAGVGAGMPGVEGKENFAPSEHILSR